MVKHTRRKLKGGANFDKNKYILLSCPEFEHVVDNILQKESKISLNSKNLTANTMKQYNSKINTLTAENKGYVKFLKEIGSANSEANKLHYLRKVDNFETEHFYRGYINWSSYGDKTPDIRMNKNTTVRLRGSKVIYFAYFSFNEPNSKAMIDQFIFLNSLSHYGISELNIVLPYFPVGTMERIVGEGEIPTADALATMLNNIPQASAKNNIYMFDIHALCSRFFFHSNLRPVLLSMMTEYMTYIDEAYPEGTEANNHNIIVFPDDGAKKRFDNLLPSTAKRILCSKTRKGEERIIRIESGKENLFIKENTIDSTKTINLFLIDDLVQTGGSVLETFDGIKKNLVSANGYSPEKIKYISIITHSVFPDDKKLESYFSDRGDKVTIDKLITTNSRPLRTAQMKAKWSDKVEILDISNGIHTVFTDPMNTTYITPYIIS